jgi:localization factor PodJL
MKSGGPWNLRGLQPEAREAAREAARRSEMSVGEWLNSIIRPDENRSSEPMPITDFENDAAARDTGHPTYRARHPDGPAEHRNEHRESERHGGGHRGKRRRRPRDRDREYDRELARARADRDAARARHEVRNETHAREEIDEASRAREMREARARDHAREAERQRQEVLEAARAREEFGAVHARLDKLSQQLDFMVRTGGPGLAGAPAPRVRAASQPGHGRKVGRPMADGGQTSVDAAIAEIAARQRALYGGAVPTVDYAEPEPEAEAPPIAPLMPPPVPAPAAAVTVDIAGLEKQLREVTARLEGLRPTSDLERMVAAVRSDLAEIAHQLTEALPRHALESLEIEVQALAQRIDHSRESGADSTALAGIEHGLAEVRDALRGLTPAENLVGFDEAVKSLAHKVDLIAVKEDPAALQQLETAIGALRGIVSHVASNDTLTKVAEDVRSLAAKIDGLANSTASGHAVLALESRLDTLANALNASAEAGHAVPRELEKLLAGLIEKLEWVQLTHTDHAALGHLEDRIAQLIKRFDASDSRLGNLEAVERGLADLLVHMDQIRGGGAAMGAIGAVGQPAAVDAIEREVAEIKRSERQTQDALEAVHGAVEQVVDRLALIESNIHEAAARPATASPFRPEAADAPPTQPIGLADPIGMPEIPASPAALTVSQSAEPQSRHAASSRLPIDPSLPPDHPLEPGSAAGTRGTPSAADRIAASEAVFGDAQAPTAAAPSEKSNFIAAARRAAQAATAAPERSARSKAGQVSAGEPEKPSRVRKILVAGGAVLIAVGCLHVALRMFQDTGSAVAPAASPATEQITPSAPLEKDSAQGLPTQAGPLVLPVPQSAPEKPSAVPAPSTPLNIAPDSKPADPAPQMPANPARQSSLDNAADITGSLPPHPPTPSVGAIIQAPAVAAEKLPAGIGGPKLRAAALAGDAAAEFEVATRYIEGHAVPPSNEQAAYWLERAAKQGLAPAQFRLGGFYEKGIGVKKDLATARDLYTAAADKGNGKAMHNLAVLYAEGINGAADYRTAARWFRKAADHGVTDSQYNLAILYARGVGVEQNDAEAYKWFTLAANHGDNEAAKKRDEIAAMLDQQSLAAANLAVQKWAPAAQPDAAVTVKAPPGGWEPAAQAAKSKPRPIGAKLAVPETKLD